MRGGCRVFTVREEKEKWQHKVVVESSACYRMKRENSDSILKAWQMHLAPHSPERETAPITRPPTWYYLPAAGSHWPRGLP